MFVVVRGGDLGACCASAALRSPIGVLGPEGATGAFALLRVQVQAMSPKTKTTPLQGP